MHGYVYNVNDRTRLCTVLYTHTITHAGKNICSNALVKVPTTSNCICLSGTCSVEMVLQLDVKCSIKRHCPGAPGLGAGVRIDVAYDTLIVVTVRFNGALYFIPRRRDEVVRFCGASKTVEGNGVGHAGTRRVAVDVCENRLPDIHASLEGMLHLCRVRGEDAVGDTVTDDTVQRNSGESANLRRTDLCIEYVNKMSLPCTDM